MHRFLVVALLLLPAVASAQQSVHRHHSDRPPTDAMPMDHVQMMHDHMSKGEHREGDGRPTEAGQAAFAATQEIVQILDTDPQTDWSKVDIEALRQHLIDMSNVTLAAEVRSEQIDDGMRFTVTGEGAVRDSIRRMTSAHAATMDGIDGWYFMAKETNRGSIFEVRVPSKDAGKLKALGFIGVMTRGMHHQEHHLMIARGGHPHG